MAHFLSKLRSNVNSPGIQRPGGLRLEHLWAVIVLASIFVMVNTHPIRPHDFWFHLAYGRIIAETHSLPLADRFSFSMAGQPYESEAGYWLAQLGMFALFRLGGPQGTILVFSLLVTAAYGLLLLMCRMAGVGWRAAAAGVLFAAVLGSSNWNIRPQLLAFPLSALSLWLLEKIKTGTHPWRWGLALMVCMAAWVNIHGTYFVPLAVLAFRGLEAVLRALHERDYAPMKPLMISLAFMLAGLLLNPRGLALPFYFARMAQSGPVQQLVGEWQPPVLQSLDGATFFALLGLSIILLIFARRGVGLAELLGFLFFGFMALRYQRAIAWFGLTQAGLVALSIDRILARSASARPGVENRRLNALVLGLQVCLALASLPWLRAYWPLVPAKKDIYARETPILAVANLQAVLPAGNVYSELGFSGYISWAGDTRYKIFVDPRFEFFPPVLWQEYLQINRAVPGWQSLLDGYNVQALVLSPHVQPDLIRAALNSPAWQHVPGDDIAELFIRSAP